MGWQKNMKLISLCIYLFLQREPKQRTEKKNNNNKKQKNKTKQNKKNNQSKYVYVRKKDAELSEKEQNNGLQQIVVHS